MSRSSRPASSAAPSCAPTLARSGSIRRRRCACSSPVIPTACRRPGRPSVRWPTPRCGRRGVRPAVVAGAIVALIVALVLAIARVRAAGTGRRTDRRLASGGSRRCGRPRPGRRVMDAGIRTPLHRGVPARRRAARGAARRRPGTAGAARRRATGAAHAAGRRRRRRGTWRGGAHARRPAARDRGVDAGAVGGDQRDGAVLRRPRRRPTAVVGRDRCAGDRRRRRPRRGTRPRRSRPTRRRATTPRCRSPSRSSR